MELSFLGMRIKEERKRQKLTLEVLSEQVGISRNFLWEIEAGRKAPALTTLYNLGVALNTSIDYLMGLTTEKMRGSQTNMEEVKQQEIAQILELLNRVEINKLVLIHNVVQCFTQHYEIG